MFDFWLAHKIFLFSSVPPISGTHSFIYLRRNERAFSSSKVNGMWSWPLTPHLMLRLILRAPVPPLPHISSRYAWGQLYLKFLSDKSPLHKSIYTYVYEVHLYLPCRGDIQLNQMDSHKCRRNYGVNAKIYWNVFWDCGILYNISG